MCIMRKTTFIKKGLFLITLFVSMTLLTTCTSVPKPTGYQEVLQVGLRQLPKINKKYKRGKVYFNVGEYSVITNKTIQTIEKGRVDLSGKLKYTERKLFEIRNEEIGLVENGETLFIFNKEGFDNETVTLGSFYGRTNEEEYPFTLSMVASPTSRIFNGKAKKKDAIFEIMGTPYMDDNIQPEEREVAFFVRYNNRLIGYIQVGMLGLNPPIVFINATLESEERQMLLYTIIFLIQYRRYDGFLINRDLVEGEK